jgi:hypothetical protein
VKEALGWSLFPFEKPYRMSIRFIVSEINSEMAQARRRNPLS